MMACLSSRRVLLAVLLVCGVVTQAFINVRAPSFSTAGGAGAASCHRRAHRSITRLFMTAAANHRNPLSLEEISNKIKFEVTDLDAGAYGLESKDVAYAVEIAKVNIPLSNGNGLGIGLEELKRGRDGRGCVLISTISPGGNAEIAAGEEQKIRVGDMICYLGREPKGMVRTEGLDFDQTMDALRTYITSTDASSITLVLKRLVFRESVEVALSYAPSPEEVAKSNAQPWTQSLPMLCGSQLRKELLRSGLPVYDRNTLRFDQPYVTGDCGGEGICGTCLVQVLEGKELLNEPDGVEEMVTKKWGAANWRLSCRVVVGVTNAPGTVRLRLMPQTPFIRKR